MSTRDTRYDVLFEPVTIGPVTSRNRFYQVPHCTGLGWLRPRMNAALRGVKAEGGWGVVCTEYCSIHPTSDDLPNPYAALWDEDDIRAHALMTEQVHAHGALAGVELWIGGSRAGNRFTRHVAGDVASMAHPAGYPGQTRAMDRADIRELRRWHRNAARRARAADFDIVYVYATHDYLLSHFLSPRTNTRTDEYGGSPENRARLLRELIEDTRDAVAGACAVAVRFSVGDGGAGVDPSNAERRDMLATLAELPDLWDINVDDYAVEMGVSRFVKEGALEDSMAFVKSVTTRPVVTVGRFTSPDAMVSQVRRGIVDFIGAARPSIADPFLPRKIEQGRIDEIRECIGCNYCYASDVQGVPIQCTQNPTIGEEWRRGWHPEKVPERGSAAKVLVVGAGPAGLEAALTLGRRGYDVVLAEARRELGGRVRLESTLPGLREWARVSQHRVHGIQGMPNVEIYRESALHAEDVLAVEADHVVIATGARWRADGVGRYHLAPPVVSGAPAQVFTPDDIMAGRIPEGPSVVFDDDHYYMGSVVAEKLRVSGLPVTLVTPENEVARWGRYTNEQHDTQKRMLELGVHVATAHALTAYDGDTAELACVYTGCRRRIAAEAIVMVTQRSPVDELYFELRDRIEEGAHGAPDSLARIGDCDAPAVIAAAVFAGHRYARELDSSADPDVAPHRDWALVEDGALDRRAAGRSEAERRPPGIRPGSGKVGA